MTQDNLWTMTALSLMTGIVVWSIGLGFWPICILGCVGLATCHLVAPHHTRLATYLVLVIVVAQGLCGLREKRMVSTAPLTEVQRLSGTIQAVTRFDRGGRIVIGPFGAPTTGVMMTLTHWHDRLVLGDIVELNGRFQRIDGALNRGDYDPAEMAARHGAQWHFSGDIRRIGRSTDWRRGLQSLHEVVRQRIAGLKDTYHTQLLSGLVLGDRRALAPTTRAAFEETGTAHLLAVSGLHIGGVSLVVFSILRRVCLGLGVFFPHRFPAVCAAMAALCMLVIAQFPVSACRATLMVCFHFIGTAIGRRPSPRETVSMAAIVSLFSAPSLLFSPGFQFSFLAVVALITMVSRTSGPMNWIEVCLIASLATAPVESWHFGTVCLGSPLTNLILTPVAASVVVPTAMLGVALYPVTTTVLELGAVMAEIFTNMAVILADMGFQKLVVGQWVTPVVIAIWLVAMQRRWKIKPWIIAGALSLCVGWTSQLYSRNSFVQFISVGQGDAILLHSMGRYALVDAGPSEAAYPLLGVLRRHGVRRLEWVMITHHHPDHFRGLSTLGQHLSIGEVRHYGQSASNAWSTVSRDLARQGITTTESWPDQESFGRLHLRYVRPMLAEWFTENDRSIAVRVDGIRQSLLLTGDLQWLGEQHLLQSKVGPIDIVQAPHHGSRTSLGEELLSALRPSMVVISCGPKNPYGFPHEEVSRRIEEHGLDLLRTDVHGSIRLMLDDAAVVTDRHPP
ncbi:MAG: DNA internalization-related competence protein ComEC/Rec2 [Myxococcota bacterium]|nr:DNA internalization-related competence protein ComEC/Rec2 [Myxococcota bacterium]